MIVLDASTLVSATFEAGTVPARAVQHALSRSKIAVSVATMKELVDVLGRPRLARFIKADRRAELLAQLATTSTVFNPAIPVTDCRDPKDNKYLELALAARADLIVSSDADLLVLHPWRDIETLSPAS